MRTSTPSKFSNTMNQKIKNFFSILWVELQNPREDLCLLNGRDWKFQSSWERSKKAGWKLLLRERQRKRRRRRKKKKCGMFGKMIKLSHGNPEECPNPLLLLNAICQLMLSLLILQKNTYLTSKRKTSGWKLMTKKSRQTFSLRSLTLFAKYPSMQNWSKSISKDALISIYVQDFWERRWMLQTQQNSFQNFPHQTTWNHSLAFFPLNISFIRKVCVLSLSLQMDCSWHQVMRIII